MRVTDAPGVSHRRARRRRQDVAGYCTCRECRRAAKILRDERSWRRFENEPTPPIERLRRWIIWHNVDHQTLATFIAIYVELPAMLVDWWNATRAANCFSDDGSAHDQAGLYGRAGLVSDQIDYEDRGIDAADDAGDDEQEQRRQDVHAKLQSIGLTDKEIAVLSRLQEGNTQREVAELCELSKTGVVYRTSSALNKITAAGYTLAELVPARPAKPKPITNYDFENGARLPERGAKE